MPFPALAVANEFIIQAGGKTPLSPMKLQKLVYYAHGWFLAITDSPLISEKIEAWKFGPVIPVLYHEFKSYGNGPITDRAISIRMTPDGKMKFETPSIDEYGDAAEAKQARDVIARVLEVYGPFSAVRLSNATHMQGSPWQEVYEDGVRYKVIPDGLIAEYFKGLVNVTPCP